ncbi:uncharacterized protein [Dermacentor albipictus]|uniref:uncharacterized protein isoform X2 n=1 Tax=Dermacentor albipictus TaxID=60249 RepID=UPI0031FE2062
MGETEMGSTVESTVEASSYTSESTVGAEQNESSNRNVYVAVAVCLAILVVLIIAVLLLTGSSSSKAQHAAGEGGEDSDATKQSHSYGVNKGPAGNTGTNGAKTTKGKTTKTLSTEKKMTTKTKQSTRRATTSKKPATTTTTTATKATTTKKTTTRKTTTKATTTKATTTRKTTTRKPTTRKPTTRKTTTRKPTTRKTTTKRTTTKRTTTTTTQRPIPPYSLACTYGPDIKASSRFPEDGVCDYTFLEQMRASRAKDFGGPYPSEVQHFINTAARHTKTEYGVAFDYTTRSRTAAASKDSSVKRHLHKLFTKRIFHYGYISTDTYFFNKEVMVESLEILKRLTSYLEDRKTPERPIYTVVASPWDQFFDRVSASKAAEVFRTVLMPDLFISKAHLYDRDNDFKDCRILPPNLLRVPQDLKTKYVYYIHLFSAIRHAGDLDKMRNKGVKTAALSVSVGLYGRWYYVHTDSWKRVKNYAPGDGCNQIENRHQLAGIAKVCKDRKYGHVQKNELFKCRYNVDEKKFMTFVYDVPETLRYKLCLSRKNATTLKYGFTAVGLEFSDYDGYCGMGKFPLLTTVKRTLEFFKQKYDSPDAYQDCLSA